MLRNVYLGIALCALLFNFLFACITVQMPEWAVDNEPEDSTVVKAYIGLWKQCDINNAQSGSGAGTTCQSILPPSVNNDNTAYTNSEQSYQGILGARAGLIVGLVITIVIVLVSAWVYWKHGSMDALMPRITLALLGLAFAQFVSSCITVGCFNSAIASQNGYLTVGRHWSAGPGLSLNIVGLVSSLATVGLTSIAALDARGYPPSKWSAALRERVARGGSTAQQGNAYAPLHPDGDNGEEDSLDRMPHRSSVERGGALPQL